MKITSHLAPNGQHKLCDETGAVVGRAWRWPNAAGFGMLLDGVYWRGDVANQRAGGTTTSCRTLREAREKAAAVLGELRALRTPQPADDPAVQP